MSSPRLAPWLIPETISSEGRLDEAQGGEAHAVDRGAVGREARCAVAELDLLDPDRVVEGHGAARGAAVGVGRDHLEVDVGQLEQGPPHGVQASGRNAVVVCRALSQAAWARVSVRRSPGKSLVRGRVAPASLRGRPSRSAAKRSGGIPSSIVPTRIRTMCRMNVSASIQNASTSPGLDPLGAEHVALEAHMLRLGGRTPWKSCVPASAAAQASSAWRSSGRGHQERAVPLERARSVAGVDAIAVGARARVAASVEAVGRLVAREHGHVRRQQRV